MTPFLKVLKALAITIAALFLLYFLFALVVWRNVATGQDRDVTTSIRSDFTEMTGTNFPHAQFIVTPSHNETKIFVSGELSKDEKENLSSIAKNVSAKFGNRKISIVYK